MRIDHFGLALAAIALGCTGCVTGSTSTGSPQDADPLTPGLPNNPSTPANPGNPSTPADPSKPADPSNPAATPVDPAMAAAPTSHYALRRLTNQEYTNTVQALLFTKQTPGDTFQESLPGSSGYTNDAQALDISSPLVASYYAAATAIAKEVIASKGTAGGAYSKLVTCTTTQASCGQQTVSALAKRALRRPVTTEDLDASTGLMSVFSAGGAFDQGLNDVIISLLMHPEFLMIPVVDAASLNAASSFALDDYEVASRLSYFLWQSMPDDALTATADQGKLHEPETLRVQVTRMLSDARAVNLKAVIRDEYAGLLALARTDFTQLGQTNVLRDAMVGETDAFINDILANDRSPLTLLNGKQSFVNKTLATWYGLTFPAGQNAASFVAVPSTRTGIGSQAAVLINTAGGSPTFTNPIKRGHWISSRLLCINPPPPPPNIPPLPPASQENPTVRQRLEAHVNTPVCTACHTAMDAVGLGAENYGPFGQWRTAYADQVAVDASGTLPGDGTPFADSASMYQALGASETAKKCVALQFMKLALSRDLSTAGDEAVASTVARAAVGDTSHFSDFIWNIVTTTQFLKQTGEAP